jgi:hypothetical protein
MTAPAGPPFNPKVLNRRYRQDAGRLPGASLTSPPLYVPSPRAEALRGDLDAFDAMCRARSLRPQGRRV